MSPDDQQKHQKLRDDLKKAKTVEDGAAAAEAAIEHLLDHIERLDKRVADLEKKTANIQSSGGKTFLG